MRRDRKKQMENEIPEGDGEEIIEEIKNEIFSEGADIKVFNLSWLVLPLGFAVLYEWMFRKFMPVIEDAEISLLAYEVILAVLVISFTLLARKTFLAGWKMPKGFSWLLVVGPVWLGIISPVGMAIENAAGDVGAVLIWGAISLLVAINEETLFRGFALRGLMKSFRPLTAVILSSIAFGLLHLVNLWEGGSPILIGAQVISATGVGAIMAALTLRSGSILPAILIHFLVDIVGLTALGGFEEALQSVEFAPSLVITGLVFFAWGLFWSWRAERAGKIKY
ncbi:MAG: hypothetical protein DHS20C05_13830 [Hyphococcus sp.]|nr:MAG: hypothetical protein DHS20C05_13830 [Marinicaulis sp.]